MGRNQDYDLSIADEIFAIFAGITLFLSTRYWVLSHPKIIVVIIIAVSLCVITIVVAINQIEERRQSKKSY